MQQIFDVIGQHNKDQIRRFYQKIIEEPTEDFEKLTGNAEKIKYCYQRLKDHNMIIDKGVSSGKNEVLAIEARNEANILFIKEKNFLKSLENYNKSLCLSLLGSENIGICYANRSAIYFETGFYDLCLKNIDLALTHNYPEKLIPKLEARRMKCVEQKNQEKPKYDEKQLKLTYNCNKNLPGIIEELEYGKSKEFGRFIQAKHDLFPGDIVIIDKPMIKCLEGTEYRFCGNCHQSNFLNLIPCESCSKAMYCGNACMKEAFTRFHQFECRVIETELNRLVIRATLMGFTLFEDLDELRKLIKSKPITGFDLNTKNSSEKDNFKAIYCLATNSSQRSLIDTFKRANILSQSWHMLITHSNLRTLLKTEDDKDLFLDTLLHFSQLAATNSHELLFMSATPTPKIDNDGLFSPQKIGSALFPVISLLNHSCAPNVCRVNSNGTIAIMVLRNIKMGDQLFDNYGCDHLHHTRDERQVKLAAYLFECQCEACKGDYPLIEGLEAKGLKFDHLRRGLSKILDYDRKWAVEYFQKSKKFLKDAGRHYPSYEICATQTILIACRKILFENTPLELHFQPINK